MWTRHIAGGLAGLLLLGATSTADAGRAAACRRTCRDVIATECGERLGLLRPDRICRKELLRQCRRDGIGVCTYPILVGSWRYEVAVCTRTCTELIAPEDCKTPGYITFTFLQKGTRLEETQRFLAGWFVDHATFAMEGSSLNGDTATFGGTMLSSTRITNVAYDAWTTHPDDGECHVHRLGELIR